MTDGESTPKPSDFLPRAKAERDKLKANERRIERQIRQLLPRYESATRDVMKHVPADVWGRFVRVHDKALELQESQTAMRPEWAWHAGKILAAHADNRAFAFLDRSARGGRGNRLMSDDELIAVLRAWRKACPNHKLGTCLRLAYATEGLPRDRTFLYSEARKVWAHLGAYCKTLTPKMRPSDFYMTLKPPP